MENGPKRCENTKGRVDVGWIEVRNHQGSNLPIKRYEMTKIEMTKERVDHKPAVMSRILVWLS